MSVALLTITDEIDAAEGLHGGAHQAIQIGIYTDICLVIVGTLAQFCRHSRAFVCAARCDHCLHARRMQAARYCSANTVCATGNDSDLAL